MTNELNVKIDNWLLYVVGCIVLILAIYPLLRALSEGNLSYGNITKIFDETLQYMLKLMNGTGQVLAKFLNSIIDVVFKRVK